VSLSYIFFPDSLTTIGVHAFNGCVKLSSIRFKQTSNCQIIQDNAFTGCESLSIISFPKSLTTIGADSLKDCTSVFYIVAVDQTTEAKYAHAPENGVTNHTNAVQTFLSNPDSIGWVLVKEVELVQTLPSDAVGIITGLPIITLTLAQTSIFIFAIFMQNNELFVNANTFTMTLPAIIFIGTEVFSSDVKTVTAVNGNNGNNVGTLQLESSVSALEIDDLGDGVYVAMDVDDSTMNINSVQWAFNYVFISTPEGMDVTEGAITTSYTQGESFKSDTDITTFTIGSIFIESKKIPSEFICFPSGEMVKTSNRGYVDISSITKRDIIGGERVLKVEVTKSSDLYLVRILKNALGLNIPFKDTLVSLNHKLLIRGKMVSARSLTLKIRGIGMVPYSSQYMYNIMLARNGNMVVNGIIAESLSQDWNQKKSMRFSMFH
jgi:hypothetical protein